MGDADSTIRWVVDPKPDSGGLGVLMAVMTEPLIRGVLRNETLTRGLDDIEARMLVEWVVNWTELLSDAAQTETEAQSLVERLIRRGRSIARFVLLWCAPRSQGAALQLAGTERFTWPLPAHDSRDPADVMQYILNWETGQESG
ncbi:MAG: hypothetical protein LC104_03670 [Bacteroidales bacterium]|nr:hypothetical protein [Bacteroidales bacterium]